MYLSNLHKGRNRPVIVLVMTDTTYRVFKLEYVVGDAGMKLLQDKRSYVLDRRIFGAPQADPG